MKPTAEQIGSLLALRRDTRPEEGYWQGFLCEFHQAQRQQAVKKAGLRGRFEVLSSWLADLGPAKWAYSAGIAYAAITVAFFLMPKSPGVEDLPLAPVKHEVVPTSPAPAVEQLEELDLSPSAQGRVGDQAF